MKSLQRTLPSDRGRIMHFRYHTGSKRNPSGKFEHRPRTGIGHEATEVIGNWTIELSHRQVGITIKRDQYSVTIRRDSPAHEERLSGFSSKSAAMAAARKKVDLLNHIRPRIVPPAHRSASTSSRKN